MTNLFFFTFLIAVGCSYSAICPRNWIEHEDTCFLFMGDIKATKSEADTMCSELGAQIVSMPTEADEHFVIEFIKKHEESLVWWTSGTRWNLCESPTTQRMWTWKSASGLQGFTHKNFMNKDEQQSNSDRNNNNKCLKTQQTERSNPLKLMENFTWVPSACNERASAICMKPACPRDWLSISTSKCMKVVEKESTYDEQVSDCAKTQGAKLLQLNSFPEYRELTRTLNLKYKDTNNTYGIEGGRYLGFKAAEFTSPHAQVSQNYHYNYNNRKTTYVRSTTTYNCNDVNTCKTKTVTFANWLTDEPKFYLSPIRVDKMDLWRPRFSIAPSYNTTWRHDSCRIFGLQDNAQAEEMWYICEKNPAS